MSKPCRGDEENIARIGKYLTGGCRRVVEVFPFGLDDSAVKAYSDPNWAGCARTRNRTRASIVYWDLHDQGLAIKPKGDCTLVSRR